MTIHGDPRCGFISVITHNAFLYFKILGSSECESYNGNLLSSKKHYNEVAVYVVKSSFRRLILRSVPVGSGRNQFMHSTEEHLWQE